MTVKSRNLNSDIFLNYSNNLADFIYDLKSFLPMHMRVLLEMHHKRLSEQTSPTWYTHCSRQTPFLCSARGPVTPCPLGPMWLQRRLLNSFFSQWCQTAPSVSPSMVMLCCIKPFSDGGHCWSPYNMYHRDLTNLFCVFFLFPQGKGLNVELQGMMSFAFQPWSTGPTVFFRLLEYIRKCM